MPGAARLWRLLPMLPICASLCACSATTVVNALTPRSGYDRHQEIRYRVGERGLLDVYVPRSAESAPVIVYFYGGRWQTGSRSQYLFVGQAFASRGILTIIPDYRLYPEVKFPDFVDDGAAVLAWARRNVQSFGGDPERIFVAGHSAGAHIAAMLNFDETFVRRVGGDKEWIAGMIGLAGPYDFLPLEDADLQDMFGPPQRYPASQPINFVDGNEARCLLLHGLEDKTVLPRNTRHLASEIRRKNGSVRTIYYDDLEHLRIVAALAAPLRGLGKVLDDIQAFVFEEDLPDASH